MISDAIMFIMYLHWEVQSTTVPVLIMICCIGYVPVQVEIMEALVVMDNCVTVITGITMATVTL